MLKVGLSKDKIVVKSGNNNITAILKNFAVFEIVKYDVKSHERELLRNIMDFSDNLIIKEDIAGRYVKTNPLFIKTGNYYIYSDFPWKKYMLNAHELWNNNINGEGLIIKGNVIMKSKDSYEKYSVLTDYFSEEARMSANIDGKESPLFWYAKNRDKLLNLSIRDRREFIWRNTKEATLFDISTAKFIYQTFNAKNVFDPSAGWGDRMLGAAVARVESYSGVDPNSQMIASYKKMRGFISRHIDGNFTVLTSGFLEHRIKPAMYDTILTSPPYFDFEVYSEEPSQSIMMYPNIEDWIEMFMKPYLRKVMIMLIPQGKFILHMSDTRRGRYMKILREYLDSLMMAKYVKTFILKAKREIPMYVYEKVDTGTIPVITYPINTEKVHGTLLTDESIIGGAKERVLRKFLPLRQEEEFVYVGPPNGFAQIALARVAKSLNKKATIFTMFETPETKLAEQYDANIIYIRGSMRDLYRAADIYISKHESIYEIPFGANNDELKKLFIEDLKIGLDGISQPSRMWLTSGSGFTLSVFQEIWPETEYMIVQVGKKIPETLIREQDTLMISPYKFLSPAKIQPPYSSPPSYDAKVWEFFLKFGKDGDYIWNTAKGLK